MLRAFGHELQGVISQQQQCQQQLQEIARHNQRTAEPANVMPAAATATATAVTDIAPAPAPQSGISRRPHSNTHTTHLNQSTLTFLRTTNPQHASADAGHGTSTQTRAAHQRTQ